MMEKQKKTNCLIDLGNKKGITLIALVITIIVLLILAGVVISTLTGDNGILQKATAAKQNKEEATELELIKLAVSAAQAKGEGVITTENLNGELRANLNDIAESIGDNWYYKEYIIYKNGNVEKYDKLLPAEYQQVEYLEANNIQCIDTGLVFKDNYQVGMKFQFLNTGRTNEYCQNWLTSDWQSSRGVLIGIYQGDFIFYAGNETKQGIRYSKKADTSIHEVIINKTGVNVDGTIVAPTNFDDIPSLNRNIRVFASNHWNNNYNEFTRRVYWCKYWNLSDTLVRNFIPCKCKSDNKPGLYDAVEGKFYTNQGTGDDFIAGPDV